MNYDFDPELLPIVESLPELDPADALALRRAVGEAERTRAATVDTGGVAIEDGDLRGAPGAPSVPYRLYRPEHSPPEPMAGILLLHGGGFMVGTIDGEHGRAAWLTRELAAAVLVIDYRLAPEHPYPAALDDAWAALEWLHREAAALGVDASRLGVVGESAGGALAATLAIRCRDQQGPPLSVQALFNPSLDDRLETASMRAFTDTPLWTRALAESSWRHYLRDVRGEVPATAAAARADDLSGLPPTYITCMEFDPLRDEALEYAGRLMASGVPVELHCFAGGFHGAGALPVGRIGAQTRDQLLTVLTRRLSR